VLGIVGVMKTAAPVTVDFKGPDRTILIVGGLGDCDLTRFGGTQYAKVILDRMWGLPPALDMGYEKCMQATVREMVCAGLADSIHDISDGGLAVALAECSFGPTATGAVIDLDSDMRPEFLLFHEGPSRAIISTTKPEAVAAIAARHGVAVVRAGVSMKERLVIRNRGNVLVDLGTRELRKNWDGALARLLSGKVTH
jgi:phosphoribosylformylglycinamidine synthase